MKQILNKYILVFGACVAVLTACKRDSDYLKSTPSPYISNLDLRKLYKGADVTLTKDITGEATVVAGQVTSDHSGHNLPEGLLFIQNLRMVGSGIDSLRGIAINIGAAAADYVPGDSVHITIENSVLKRSDGVLQITGVSPSNVKKVASGVKLLSTPMSAATVLGKPGNFEGCFGTMYNCNFEPNIGIEKVEGSKTFNDGSGDMQMYVRANANFKSEFLPYSAEITGIIIPSSSTGLPQICPRVKKDFFPTSITVDASIPLGPNPAVITGYFANPSGTDANYEYIQFMATQDLDFRQKPFTVYATNNAGSTNPFPVNGWNTGGVRTYKFNITRGTVAKGKFFYVGGYKQIAGVTSTDISQANWVVSKLYNDNDGDDGIGTKTANLLANSGNTAGIAIFATNVVELTTAPSDCVFYAGQGGNVYGNGVGYSVCDNDLYKRLNGTTAQPFVGQGTNTFRFVVPEDSKFSYLGGVYDATQKKWTTVRTHSAVTIAKASALSSIEEMEGATRTIN
ncbi:DUF5689 domain-containing protein [Pedobacter sp. MC2016-14]|uniref:DUF5689 domain-containing protein n=1 Tax=Pedobacter sp. MC2016-14 TaxID=2897327 RepID=UPI001E3B6BFE|nr:DUF5689 domain-containing protein [Pedobacter sp. MC2016-14]MCD0488160.1 DUF5689 domain-containing protein [Pedobacter sp. MC2016-14]